MTYPATPQEMIANILSKLSDPQRYSFHIHREFIALSDSYRGHVPNLLDLTPPQRRALEHIVGKL